MPDADALYDAYHDMMFDFTSGHGVPDDEGEILIENSILRAIDNGVGLAGIGDWLANDIARRARHYATYIAALPPEQRKTIREQVYRLPLASLQRLRTEFAVEHPTRIVTLETRLVHRLREAPDDVFMISPREFELVVAELLSDMGARVQLTPPTRDGGYDIAAIFPLAVGEVRYLVEVKRWNAKRAVGVEIVRALHGVVTHADANVGLLVTTSRFSRDAEAYQSTHNARLKLSDYAALKEWLDRYPRAKRI